MLIHDLQKCSLTITISCLSSDIYMNICVISPSYPTQDENSYQFVANLCNTFAQKGNTVYVISPLSITKRILRKKKKITYSQESYSYGDNKVVVFSPEYISYGNFFFSRLLNLHGIRSAIEKTISRNKLPIDVMYGHFWISGLNAYKSARKRSIPLFVATGESTIRIEDKNQTFIKRFSDYVNGVVCVSSKNKDESIKLGLTSVEKCIVLPNAYNHEVFYPKDKWEMRRKLGFKESDFIVAFVGHFIERKGPKRVSSAIEEINIPQIKAIYIGKEAEADTSPEKPGEFNTLFKGAVKNSDLPDYLSCADVFVLPTLHEGCCNAIIEAMACGLPIISSKRDFNYDILDDTNSIMVDPMNVQEISNAILQLYNDEELRVRLSKGALKKVSNLTLASRADKILDFINTKR